MRLFLALKAFFSTLANPATAQRVAEALAKTDVKPSHEKGKLPVTGVNRSETQPKTTAAPTNAAQSGATSGRSEALTLLSTLQREARLLDLIHESLDMYTDAQIGAAARDVLRDARKSLDKMLEIKPLLLAKEGDSVDLIEPLSPVRWKLLGAKAPRGVIVHAGWMAAKLEIPKWNGSRDDALVLAAAEIET
ncbi:DUF2760 domain-containing protein [Pirellulaceae bacterium SH449]